MAGGRYSVARPPLKWFLLGGAFELRNSYLRRPMENYLGDDRYSGTFVENLDLSLIVHWLQVFVGFKFLRTFLDFKSKVLCIFREIYEMSFIGFQPLLWITLFVAEKH